MKHLSIVDGTFLHMESAEMPMHVGSAAMKKQMGNFGGVIPTDFPSLGSPWLIACRRAVPDVHELGRHLAAAMHLLRSLAVPAPETKPVVTAPAVRKRPIQKPRCRPNPPRSRAARAGAAS